MNTHLFKSGPPLSVNLSGNGKRLTHVSLIFGKAFLCTWEGIAKIEPYLAWLENYSLKLPTALPFLDLEELPPFHRIALEYLQKIPFGETASYKEVAVGVNHPRAARAVGNACNKNPYPLFIPCHRVIASQGKLGGFAIDMRIKRALLEFEAHQQ